jgi:hypothetical protein
VAVFNKAFSLYIGRHFSEAAKLFDAYIDEYNALDKAALVCDNLLSVP